MATRTACGRLGVARALGLLVAFAITAVTGATNAQQFAPQGEFSFADDDTFATRDGFRPQEMPADWSADCGAGECYACGDTCGECRMPAPGCPCGSYASDQVWWFGADYLVWRIDGSALPALVTDSPINTSPVLGSSTTSVLAGDNVVGNKWRSGYRLRTGVWLDAYHSLAVVGDYFQLGDDDYNFFFAGDSGRNTGRPFFNTQTGTQFVRAISGTYAGPVTFDGTVSVTTGDDFQGAGLTLERSVYAIGDVSGGGPGTQIILIGGYRFYSYDSRLAISDSVTTLASGSQSFKRDDFSTSNEFHGGEFGAQVRFTQQNCWFDGLAKIAVGGQRSSAIISGETVTVPAGMVAQTADGGLLTSSETNIGHYSNSRARVIPELRVGVGAYLTPNWTVRAGYSVIVWGSVARAAGLLPPNLAVDPRNSPPVAAGGGVSPLFPGIGGSELVAHGLDIGMEYAY